MKVLLIDSNKTIENHDIVKQNKDYFFNILEQKYNIKTDMLINYSNNFYKKYGDNLWEYHPIFWRYLVKDFRLKVSYQKLYANFLDFYEENIELYPDVIEFLKKCKGKYILVLVANGNENRLERLIKKFNLHEWFSEIVISGETPYKKPDRFMFEFALIRLEINVNDAIMIGDRYDTDIKGAKYLGIKTVLIKRNIEDKIQQYITPAYIPDFTVYNLEEAWDLLCIGHKNQWNSIPLISLNNRIYKNQKITSVLLLAGGMGSRLGELGKTTQKCMLPVNNIPLLFFQINAFKNAGCNKFVIVVNHLANQVKEYFGDGKKFGAEIIYLEGKYVSTYDAMYHALPYLEDNFYYCHGNIVFDERLIEKMWEIFCYYNKSILATIKNAFSVTHAKMIVSNNKIIDLSTKPKDVDQQIYNSTFMGIAIYNKDNIIKYSDNNMNGMVEKNVKQLLDNGEIAYSFEYSGNWWHIETNEDYSKICDRYFWEVNFYE